MANLYTIEDLLIGKSYRSNSLNGEIINGEKTEIDIGKVNGTPFFCTSGVGFDAHIGKLFATSEKRGLKTYAKIVISQLFNYKPELRITVQNDLHLHDH